MPEPAIEITTPEYVWSARRAGFKFWLAGGPDYSRCVEYPLASRQLRLEPGEKLLDVGAGRKAEFGTLMAERGAKVTGIDAREDIGVEADPSIGIEFKRCDARDLPFEDATFDAISAISTLEHIEEGVDKSMSEMARVLKPGGRMFVTVPYNPLKVAKMYVRGEMYGNTGDRVFFCHVFDEDALQSQLIEPAGIPVAERVNLGEPGRRMSTYFYSPRGAAKRVRYLLPIGPALGLLAPRFLKPVTFEDYNPNDWLGVAAAVTFERPAA